MRPQYSGRIADSGFDDGSSNFFYLGPTRVEIPPRAPAETFLRHAGAQNSDLQSYNRLKDRDITYESQRQFNGRSAIERMR